MSDDDGTNVKIETFSILAGSMACNARCPFCVSKMTPENGMTLKEPDVNWKAFDDVCRYAKNNDIQTAMITGKGEPALFPEQISNFMEVLKDYRFPSVELQTNGIPIADDKNDFEKYLNHWHKCGMRTIAISIVHYDAEKNRQVYLPYRKSYIDLPGLIEFLHDDRRRFNVRLACIMLDGFVDDPQGVKRLMDYARENLVEQITIRPVNKPEESRDPEVRKYVEEHKLSNARVLEIKGYLDSNGRVLKTFPYGGAVYDINGQNVCITNSLTHDRNKGSMRQLIFFPDGQVMESWTKPRRMSYGKPEKA